MTSNPIALMPALSSLRNNIAFTTRAHRRLPSVLLAARHTSQAARPGPTGANLTEMPPVPKLAFRLPVARLLGQPLDEIIRFSNGGIHLHDEFLDIALNRDNLSS